MTLYLLQMSNKWLLTLVTAHCMVELVFLVPLRQQAEAYDTAAGLIRLILHDSRVKKAYNTCLFPWLRVGWLVGCFGFNGPLRQYFSLYMAVSQKRGRKRKERIDESKMSKQPPPAPTASVVVPCPIVIKIVGRPGTESLPSTIAPPYHPPAAGK